jgi:polyisoprenyl-phosphate glycosyltransferase
MSQKYLLSVVVPAYNEAEGLAAFHASLMEAVQKAAPDDYELIYVDDGSTDATAELVRQRRVVDQRIRLVKLSRNFGKENALAAGITAARGNAIIMLDADGQHPVELIPAFVEAWRDGAQVVVGVRTDNQGEGWFKRFGSHMFYKLYNGLTGERLVPKSTDFRLIDRAVQQAFLGLTETDRMTRALIDWLGFQRAFISYKANARTTGSAGYNRRKLIQLAMHSFVSFTSVPLYLFGYMGVLITLAAFVLGGTVMVEQILLGDPWGWKFTGTAALSILLLFLVGILLMSQGMLSLYISHIHSQSKRRPLYVIDYGGSAGVERSTRV